MKYDDQPVDVFRRCYYCTLCGNGHIEFTGSVLMCNPPRYMHRCLQCGEEFALPAQHGEIIYKYKESHGTT